MSAALELVAIRLAYVVGAIAALLWAGGEVPQLGGLFWGIFAQWDAGWFLRIVRHGYDTEQSAAFFPLYPLLVRALAVVVRSDVAAGFLISLASAAGAAAILQRLTRSRDAVILLALYPVAYVFTAVYSDALFLLLAIASFYSATRGRSVAAGILGGLAVATRLLGLALLPALVLLLWRRGGARKLVPLVLLPAALGAYMLYLHERFHDWLAFSHAEGVFWLRETPWLGPLDGLWRSAKAAQQGLGQLVLHLPSQGHLSRADKWATWNLVQFLLLVAAFWLTWLAWRRLGAAYGLYSAATLVIVLSSPAAIVPLVSLPRFLLADFPLFVVLAPYRRVVAPVFAAVGAVAAVAFARGIWVA